MKNLKSMILGLVIGLGSTGALAQTSGSTTAPNSATSPESRAIAAELLADAASRTPNNGLGQDGSGFYLGRSDGLRLNVGGDLQFRYTANFRDLANGDNEYTGGFDTNMARLRLGGQVVEGWDFNLSAAFRDSLDDNGEFNLENAYMSHSFWADSKTQFGQFKLPFMREVNVDDRFQMGVDRSVVSSIFGQGYSQGVQVQQDFGNFRLTGAFSDGFNTANTDYTDPAEADFALTVRGDYLVAGDWNQLNDFTSAQGSGQAILLGGAINYQDGQSEDVSYTADLTFKSGGWSTYLAGVGRSSDSGNGSFDDFGVEFQEAYRFNDRHEVFGRYDGVFADSSRNVGDDNCNFLSAGYNYYLVGHAAKFTLQGVYSCNDTSGLPTLGNVGLLGSTKDGEVGLVAQFQLSF